MFQNAPVFPGHSFYQCCLISSGNGRQEKRILMHSPEISFQKFITFFTFSIKQVSG